MSGESVPCCRGLIQPLRSVTELEGLESQGYVQRHLQIPMDKPCAAAFFAGRALPVVGMRSQTFYALAAELRRMGVQLDRAVTIILNLWKRQPPKVTAAPGADGRPFTLKAAEDCARSAYRARSLKSYGCNSPVWSEACVGAEACEFRSLLTRGGGQSRLAAHDAFLRWMAARDAEGKKCLTEGDIRVYCALDSIEARRGFKPGTRLYASWREIAQCSGIQRHKTGEVLRRLFWHGLIRYKPGDNSRRGMASEIERVIPVPQPPQYLEGTG